MFNISFEDPFVREELLLEGGDRSLQMLNFTLIIDWVLMVEYVKNSLFQICL